MNLSESNCEIVFVREKTESPICVVSPSRSISDHEAFGNENTAAPEYSSIRVHVLNDEGLTLNFDNIHHDAEIKLTMKPPAKEIVEVPSWSAWFSSLAKNGFYALGTIGFAKIGFGMGQIEGAKWGGVIGVHIAQEFAASISPVLSYLFGPMIAYAGQGIGTAGGCALGAVAGAVTLPLVFLAGAQTATLIISYFREDHVLDLQAYVLNEESFVLVEKPLEPPEEKPFIEGERQASREVEDGWFFVEDEEDPNAGT